MVKLERPGTFVRRLDPDTKRNLLGIIITTRDIDVSVTGNYRYLILWSDGTLRKHFACIVID